MSMNRETKRMLQRQGQLGPDGEQAPPSPRQQQRPQPRQTRERTSPGTYVKEVRSELRKVAWPSREEVARYSVIVLFTVAILTTMIFALDYAFAKAVFFLFDQ
jgi:preprotein translocase subunit SecE